MKKAKQYTGIVQPGSKQGREIGFPTANLDPAILPADTARGVWAASVWFRKVKYAGALYFGPRLVMNEQRDVLEIYLLEFSADIYGQGLTFELVQFIRPPLDFASLTELKAQLQQDCLAVAKVLQTGNT